MGRAIWLCVVLLLGMLSVVVAADTPGEEAVKSAIKTLKEKRAAVKDKGDQALLDVAIKDLEERLAQVGKGEANEAKKDEPFTMPKGWELKFNTGKSRPSYDPKTGVLKLSYDFSDAKQLKDFEFDKDAKPTLQKGTLSIKGGDAIKHIVNFKTISVSSTVIIGSQGNVFDTSKNENGQQYYLWVENGRGGTSLVTGVVERPKFPIFHTPKEFRQHVIGNSVPITITDWFVSETKAGLKANGIDVSWKRPTDGPVGHLILRTGTAPNRYSKFVISGTLDPEWAKEFFADKK
jgi:hypothetical protein